LTKDYRCYPQYLQPEREFIYLS